MKVYAVDEKTKRDVEGWNAAAWSNFVKVYAVDDGKEKGKRDEGWNCDAWWLFLNVNVFDESE